MAALSTRALPWSFQARYSSLGIPSSADSTTGYSSMTVRGTWSARSKTKNRTGTMARNPNMLAFMMLTRSGMLANRQTPRYRPTFQKINPCTTRISAISSDQAGVSTCVPSTA
jgi:hypothetical protein